MTTTLEQHTLAAGAERLGAVLISDGRYAYHDEAGYWYIATAKAVQDLGARLLSGQPDAYFCWYVETDSVRADWLDEPDESDEERGQSPSGLRQFLWDDADDATGIYAAVAAADAATADAAAYADAAADTTTDAANAAVAADAADTANADAANANIDAVDTAANTDAADLSGERKFNAMLRENPKMREGLTLVQIPGRYGYGVTLVGWAKHAGGDWFDLHKSVSVVRTSGSRTLGQLAADGPMDDHHVNDVAENETPEQFHSWRVRRVREAGETAWAKWCPKPKGWNTEKKL